MTRWHYMGDINLEYGGYFFDFSEVRHGYATVIEVTDLDSACGFRGAVMVEEKTVTMDRKDRWNGALSTVGASVLPNGDIDDNGCTLRKDSLAWRKCLAYALIAAGAVDTERSDILQLDRTAPVTFDGWTAERIRSNGLRGYVRREFLGLTR